MEGSRMFEFSVSKKNKKIGVIRESLPEIIAEVFSKGKLNRWNSSFTQSNE